MGTVVVKGDALLEVVKWSYTQGQARASGNVQVEYRNLRTGGKTGERLSPSDKVERAVLDSEVGSPSEPRARKRVEGVEGGFYILFGDLRSPGALASRKKNIHHELLYSIVDMIYTVLLYGSVLV